MNECRCCWRSDQWIESNGLCSACAAERSDAAILRSLLVFRGLAFALLLSSPVLAATSAVVGYLIGTR